MKVFVWMLVGMIVLGVALGGSFLAGIAVGEDQEAEAAVSAASIGLPAIGGQGSEQSSGSLLEQLRSRIQSGDLTQEELAQLRQQFVGQLRQGGGGGPGGGGGGLAGGGGFARGGGLRGTVESIDGNTVTLNTAQGPLQVTISLDTTIQVTSEGGVADLTDGMTLTVVGERAEDGSFLASTIFALPEGVEGFGGFGGGRRGGGGGGFGGGGGQ